MPFTPQQQKVTDYVERWGSINAMEAIRKLGITRLAARIGELKTTSRAMKAVKTGELAPGFVTYVPDYRKRFENLKVRYGEELRKASGDPLALAEVSLKYTAKLSHMSAKMKEAL